MFNSMISKWKTWRHNKRLLKYLYDSVLRREHENVEEKAFERICYFVQHLIWASKSNSLPEDTEFNSMLRLAGFRFRVFMKEFGPLATDKYDYQRLYDLAMQRHLIEIQNEELATIMGDTSNYYGYPDPNVQREVVVVKPWELGADEFWVRSHIIPTNLLTAYLCYLAENKGLEPFGLDSVLKLCLKICDKDEYDIIIATRSSQFIKHTPAESFLHLSKNKDSKIRIYPISESFVWHKDREFLFLRQVQT